MKTQTNANNKDLILLRNLDNKKRILTYSLMNKENHIVFESNTLNEIKQYLKTI